MKPDRSVRHGETNACFDGRTLVRESISQSRVYGLLGMAGSDPNSPYNCSSELKENLPTELLPRSLSHPRNFGGAMLFHFRICRRVGPRRRRALKAEGIGQIFLRRHVY